MRKLSHVQYDIEYHIVWTSKYRYPVLKGTITEKTIKDYSLTPINRDLSALHSSTILLFSPLIRSYERCEKVCDKLPGYKTTLI